MEFLGQGIAIAGVWLGVGLIGYKNGSAGATAAFFAMLATVAIATR